MKYPKRYDVIVVGSGHAGIEAALASARMGVKTLLLTINVDTVAFMSCNPAMGGPAKSQLIREVDALGGQIAISTDLTFLQMKMLNMKKGPAVRALRAQSDKALYHMTMRKILDDEENLDLKQAMVEEILVTKKNRVKGVRTKLGIIFSASQVIITTGTFLRGKIHIGLINLPAGRIGEMPANELSKSLKKLGLKLTRLKTGTPPRLDRKSIDFSKTTIQPGDEPPRLFSFNWEYQDYGLKFRNNPQLELEQVPCYLTHTTKKTHQIIKKNLDRSPLFTGIIQGTGPRYCPSIEDKVVRFPEKDSHQIFLEPEGRSTNQIYAQGMNTSLPQDVQLKMLRSMPGLERVEIIRPGYAVEYDALVSDQLKYTLETKKIKGLFTAGQLNGTSGYEEAAAQGIVAGINAALKVLKKEPFILRRDDSYIGTLIDDLITKEIKEPYRMLTSRSEYRLLLRQDNADLRLTAKGYQVGLIKKERFKAFLKKEELIKKEIKRLKKEFVSPNVNILKRLKINLPKKKSLAELLKTPHLFYQDLAKIPHFNPSIKFKGVIEQIETSIKYDGYIKRQKMAIDRFQQLEEYLLPLEIDYHKIAGLCREAQLKLTQLKPYSLGQASRIAGVSPADISVLLVYLKSQRFLKKRKN